MKVISIINFKGGVAKTISAINISYALVVGHGARVLLIDNDKQGNTSKFFGLHSYEAPSLSDVLTVKGFDIRKAIFETPFEGLHVLPSNMNLIRANKEILLDVARPQQTRLKKALRQVCTGTKEYDNAESYDYVIIDNAPDLSMSAINALVACDDILIPIKVDQFAFDGLDQLLEQVEEIREFNEGIRIAGCFITMYAQNNVNVQGHQAIRDIGIPVFDTVIRKTVKVDETTFLGLPLLEYAKNCTAAQDYEALVAEYLDKYVTGISTNEGSGLRV